MSVEIFHFVPTLFEPRACGAGRGAATTDPRGVTCIGCCATVKGTVAGSVLEQLRAELLHDRHSEDACPCRKRHHVAPKPAPPDAPPNQGKAARHFREAFDKLLGAAESGDENVMATAALAVPRVLELADYAAAYEHYVAAMRDWSPEICGDCGASMLAVTGTGCARCVSTELLALFNPGVPS